MKIFKKIIKDLRKHRSFCVENIALYREKKGDFTRESKLNFSKLSLMLLSLFKSLYKVN